MYGQLIVDTMKRSKHCSGGESILKSRIVGQIPLMFAAENGHEGVVKILLGCGEVNPDGLSNCDCTLLRFVAGYGHKGVVKILLGREEADPDKPNILDGTPLSCAAQYGHEGVVKIPVLPRREEVTPKNQVIAATHRCRMPLGLEKRGW